MFSEEVVLGGSVCISDWDFEGEVVDEDTIFCWREPGEPCRQL